MNREAGWVTERPSAAPQLRLVPVSLTTAKAFVANHHRHNLPPVGWKFGVAAAVGNEIVGVAMAGRPVARALDDGYTLEVIRTCTIGDVKNVNSMLYGAIARAAKALGYTTIYTYTRAEEPGSSLRAAGWKVDAELGPRPTWDTPSRRRKQIDDDGKDRRPPGPKVRWIKRLAAT